MGCGQKAADDYYNDVYDWFNKLNPGLRNKYESLNSQYKSYTDKNYESLNFIFSYIQHNFFEDYEKNIFESFKKLKIHLVKYIQIHRKFLELRKELQNFKDSTGHP